MLSSKTAPSPEARYYKIIRDDLVPDYFLLNYGELGNIESRFDCIYIACSVILGYLCLRCTGIILGIIPYWLTVLVQIGSESLYLEKLT